MRTGANMLRANAAKKMLFKAALPVIIGAASSVGWGAQAGTFYYHTTTAGGNWSDLNWSLSSNLSVTGAASANFAGGSNPGSPTATANDDTGYFTGTTGAGTNYGTVTLDSNQTLENFGVGLINGEGAVNTSTVAAIGTLTLVGSGSGTTLNVTPLQAATTTSGIDGIRIGGTVNAVSGGGFGAAGNTLTSTGTLTLGNLVTVNQTGGTFYLGCTDFGETDENNNGVNFFKVTGTVSMQSGSTLNIGTVSAPTLWQVGVNNINSVNGGTANLPSSNGSFSGASAGAGTLTANLSAWNMGTDFRGGGEQSSTPIAGIGTVDLTNLASANINVAGNLTVGAAATAEGKGTLTLGATTVLTVTGVNPNPGTAYGAPGVYVGYISGSNNSDGGTYGTTGQVNMKTGSQFNIGTSSTPIALVIGSRSTGTLNGYCGTTVTTIGMMTTTTTTYNGVAGTGTGGTFNGYFTSVYVGEQSMPASTVSGHTADAQTAVGVLDLTNATIANFSLTGTLGIGYNGGTNTGVGTGQGNLDASAAAPNSQGTVLLPSGQSSVGTSVIVGDNVATSTGFGLLSLKGNNMQVGTSSTGTVTVNNRGQIAVEVLNGSSSAGLQILNSSPSALSLTTNTLHSAFASHGYTIKFDADPTQALAADFVGTSGAITTSDSQFLYGLSWAGNQESVVQAYITSGELTVTTLGSDTPKVFYDSSTNTTYVGFALVPEPSSAALVLAAGGMGLLRRRRRAV